MARFQRASIRQKSWAGWDCWTTFSQNWKHEASTASAKSSVRRSELRDPAAGHAVVYRDIYRTFTYFRKTRGRGSPPKTFPYLSTVPNSAPLPVVVPGLPP